MRYAILSLQWKDFAPTSLTRIPLPRVIFSRKYHNLEFHALTKDKLTKDKKLNAKRRIPKHRKEQNVELVILLEDNHSSMKFSFLFNTLLSTFCCFDECLNLTFWNSTFPCRCLNIEFFNFRLFYFEDSSYKFPDSSKFACLKALYFQKSGINTRNLVNYYLH